MEKQEKIVPTFAFMDLTYLIFEDESHSGIPAMRRCGVLNDGTVIIREYEQGTGNITKEEKYHADVYEVARLYDNIKRILNNDECDKDSLSGNSNTVQIQFQIVYSQEHEETCTPFLTDSNGISIMSVYDGFLAFVKKEHTYYNWYEVAFNDFDSHGYSYFFDDDSIQVGDKVVVPTGKDNKEKIGTVINFLRLAEENLPYPAEKTKKIIRKLKTTKPYDIDAFLKKTEYTENTTFLITDRKGFKNKCHIIGDHRNDNDAKESYLKCWLFVGVYRTYTSNEIASIRKLKDE